MAAEDVPDAITRDDDASPALLAKLGRDALRPEAGTAKGEGNDALFDPRRGLVGHAWQPPLPWPQGVDAPLPHFGNQR